MSSGVSRDSRLMPIRCVNRTKVLMSDGRDEWRWKRGGAEVGEGRRVR